jgi:uncharacterized protein YutE (UPF0331/DUF86 family)
MAGSDFAQVLQELDALEAELDPMRLLVDEGEQTLARAPTAFEHAYRQLESAIGHTLGAARALVEQAEWKAPEEDVGAIEVLVERDVLPERIGADIVEIAEFTNNAFGDMAWESDGLYDRMARGVDTLSEYVEYVHHFLKDWGE